MFTNLSSPSIPVKALARNLLFAVLQIHIIRLYIDPGVCSLQHTTVDWHDRSVEFGSLKGNFVYFLRRERYFKNPRC